MLDVGAEELLVIVVVAILVIGPKDMPVALRAAGRWIGKIRRISGHFRSGIDAMIREAEMEEMEKKWQEQNRRVMEQNPSPEMDDSNSGAAIVAAPQPDSSQPENLLPAELPVSATEPQPPAQPAAAPKAPAKRASRKPAASKPRRPAASKKAEG